MARNSSEFIRSAHAGSPPHNFKFSQYHTRFMTVVQLWSNFSGTMSLELYFTSDKSMKDRNGIFKIIIKLFRHTQRSYFALILLLTTAGHVLYCIFGFLWWHIQNHSWFILNSGPSNKNSLWVVQGTMKPCSFSCCTCLFLCSPFTAEEGQCHSMV